jgi:predicted nucleic acid-binding protein
MKIAVKDANVLIDLEIAGLLDLWFQLGHQTLTTDLVVGQLKVGQHKEILSHVSNGNINVHKCSGEFLVRAFDLMTQIGYGPDIADCSVLLLAIDSGAMLLSGDKPLRKGAVKHEVEVHGTLWILDQLIAANLLSRLTAVAKLEHLIEQDSYYPPNECQHRLRKWRSE